MCRGIIQNKMQSYLGQKADFAEVEIQVQIPDNYSYGDYTSNVALKLSSIKHRSAMEVAQEIINLLQSQDDFFRKECRAVAVQPGFINFQVSKDILTSVIQKIILQKENFGRKEANNRKVIIEYSSPNIAKPMGVHHLRSTVIGQALVNLYKFLGYEVLAMSFPGDWGTQFGMLIAAYKKWGSEEEFEKNPLSYMLDLYIRFNKESAVHSELQEEARLEFKKLEEGDEENRRIWEKFRQKSMEHFEQIYSMLGIEIPYVFGESFFEPMLKEVMEEAESRGIAQRGEDGSLVVKFSNGMTPLLLQKSDGATLYATRDLAQIKYRMQKWHPEKILYVVGNQQTLHFRQVFRVAEMLGYARREQLLHIKFGTMLGPGGKKFSTREGKTIPLEEVLKEAVKRAYEVVERLNPNLSSSEKENIARAVGIGAVKFFDLSQNRMTDIVFDWERILNLKGASAPYLQYTYARLRSILRTASKNRDEFDPAALKEQKEILILRHLLHFKEIIEDAAMRYEANILAEYLLRLADYTNSFYESCPILKSEEKLRKTRLALIEAVVIVLKQGLEILGIEVVERM